MKKWGWKSWLCAWLFASCSISGATEIKRGAMTPFAVAYLITAVVALILFVWSCLKTQNIKLSVILTTALIVPVAVMLIFNGSLSRFLVYIYFVAILLAALVHKYGRPQKKQ